MAFSFKKIKKSLKKYQADAPKRHAAAIEKQKNTLEIEKLKTANLREKAAQNKLKPVQSSQGGFNIGFGNEPKKQKQKQIRIGI